MTVPNRARSGPARRIEARILEQSAGSSGLGRTGAGVDPDGVGAGPLDARAEIGEQREHRLDIADAGNVLELERPVGEHARGEDGQRRVLVAGRMDRTAQRTTAADEKTWRHGQSWAGPETASSAARGLRWWRYPVVFTECARIAARTGPFGEVRTA